MPNIYKALLIALLLIATGYAAAYNAKWVRDGISPWWTSYFVSIVTSTTYAYLLKSALFELTYTSAFQTFFFHTSWYITTIFIIGEHLAPHRLFGLVIVFVGMLLMSIK
jgi:hypothetical protein